MPSLWWRPLCAKRKSRRVHKGFLIAAVLILGIGIEKGQPDDFSYKKKGRDPFWPLVTEEGKLVQGFDMVTLENIYLEGIVWDPNGDSMVMMNGMVLHQGDRIGDYTILKIENDRILLQVGEEQHFLNLEKDF